MNEPIETLFGLLTWVGPKFGLVWVEFVRLCGGKPLVAVTRERRYGLSPLHVNDNNVDECIVLL